MRRRRRCGAVGWSGGGKVARRGGAEEMASCCICSGEDCALEPNPSANDKEDAGLRSLIERNNGRGRRACPARARHDLACCAARWADFPGPTQPTVIVPCLDCVESVEPQTGPEKHGLTPNSTRSYDLGLEYTPHLNVPLLLHMSPFSSSH